MKKLLLIITVIFFSSIVSANFIKINDNTTLWAKKYGHKKPVIILINGSTDTINKTWQKIIPSLAKIATVIAYNRQGQKKSSSIKSLKPITAQSVIFNLRKLLQILKVKPPYILIGKYNGGLYAQYFARRYPAEIVGLVTINSNLVTESFPQTVPWLSDKMVKYLQAENKHAMSQYASEIKNRKQNQPQSLPTHFLLEQLGQQASAKQVMNLPPLSKNLALAVLTTGNYRIENKLQKSFSKQVPNSVFLRLSDSDPNIQIIHPKLFINIIKNIQLKSKSRNREL